MSVRSNEHYGRCMQPGERGKPRHVLVVDDDGEVRTSLGDWLRHSGFEVDVACDGLEAQHKLEWNPDYQAVVCDLNMPRMDGPGLLRWLHKRHKRMVVVVLSGRFDLLARALDLGQIYALAKPCDPDRLVHTLQQALQERS
jgi:two-component system, OmpR family, response regulator